MLRPYAGPVDPARHQRSPARPAPQAFRPDGAQIGPVPLFATKPIATLRADAEATGEHALVRALGPLNLVTLGIGAVIGAGIFVITGQVAALYAGPAVPLSMVVVGVACAFTGLCYAEMASAVPVAGSAYTYAYATMLIVAAMSAVLVIGIKESARVNSLIVILKVAIVLLVVLVGVSHVRRANWTPFIPPNTGEWGTYGWSGVLRGAGLVFFSYIGFDAVSTAAQESKNPQRDMPIGILGSLAICTLLYVVVSAVLVGMVPYGELNLPAPIAYAMERIGAPWWIRVSIDVGAVLGIGSVILVMLLGQSRVFYSMSRDGLLGRWASKVHPRFRTPYLSTIYTGIAVCLATGLLPLQLLGTWVNIGTLLAFVLVCAGVWILRRTRPDLERPFRTPWVPVVPILGIVCCVGLMLTLPGDTWVRLAVWLVIGLAIYFGYGRKHSALKKGV